jgi:hypothetical protein
MRGLVSVLTFSASICALALAWSPAQAAPAGTIYGAQLGVGVFAMSSDGSGRRLVIADPSVGAVSAAPDGLALAYSDKASSTLRVTDASGSLRASITVVGRIGSIAWAPDSSTVAFTLCVIGSSTCSLLTVSPDGSAEHTLVPATSDGSGVAGPISWGIYGLAADLIGSAGGAICEPCSGLPYGLASDGSVAGPLLAAAMQYTSSNGYLAQTNVSGEISYSSGSGRTAQVLVFDASGSSRPFATYAGFVAPALSPDGSELVMSNGHQVLEVQPESGAQPQPIASFDTYGVTSLSWVGLGPDAGGACSVALSPGGVQGIVGDPSGSGYWLADAYGSVSACGTAADFGGAANQHLYRPVVSISAMPDGHGYRLGAYDGGVLNFGSATAQHGPGTTSVSLSGLPLSSPVWSIASTPTGNGYWLATTDGHVYTFGDAGFFGPPRDLHLVAPLVQLVPTPDGKGYWMASSDGGVFSFGDARFAGSLAGRHLPGPIVAMAADPVGGYWLVGSDGTVYAFGGAPALGSAPNAGLSAPIRAMAATPDGRGYWLVDTNGRVYVFGDAVYAGSASQSP